MMRKPGTGSPVNADSADRSRRSFFFRLGAGASGALAATAGLARDASPEDSSLALQVALLRDEQALRELHRSFERALDSARYEDVVEMFADDAEVIFNGGVFANRSRGVGRVFERFRSGKTGQRMEPAPGYELADRRERVEVAADRLSATAIFPFSIRVGMPVEFESSLASMARLHGEGVRTWWEGGVYNVIYRRRSVEDAWAIGRLEFDTQSRADYRSGRSHAGAITVPRLAIVYPDDPLGPDALA